MAAGGLYFAAVWGPLLTSNLLLLAYLLVLAAFTLPKGYELKKDEVDGLVDTARVHVTAVHDKFLAPVLAKIPRASTARPAESSSTKKETSGGAARQVGEVGGRRRGRRRRAVQAAARCAGRRGSRRDSTGADSRAPASCGVALQICSSLLALPLPLRRRPPPRVPYIA